jgi:hypothetical protein
VVLGGNGKGKSAKLAEEYLIFRRRREPQHRIDEGIGLNLIALAQTADRFPTLATRPAP